MGGKMKKKHIFLALLFLSATSSVIRAEDKQMVSNTVSLDRIVVTPSRIEKDLSDVPASVSVITKEDIKNSDAKTVPEAIKNLEGIYSYDTTGVGAGGTINMRGFYGGMSSHHLVLIDGVPQNKGEDKLVDWDLIPVDNIERIEVLRGSASTLYGDNAMSGVINIITKKPSDAPHAAASFSYGTYNTQNYASYLSGTFNRMGYYLGLSSRLTTGFREHSDYENIQVYGKSNYSINDAHNLRFSFDYSAKTQGTFPWALSEAQIAQNRRQAKPGTENDSNGANKFNIDFTHHWDLGTSSDLETVFYYRFEGRGSFYTSGATQETTGEQIRAENTFGLPIRLKTVSEIFGMDHSFVIGIDLERNDFGYEKYNAPYQQRGALQSDYGVKRDKIGPYLQDEIKLSDSLRLIAGVRYDRVLFDFDDRITASNSKTEKMSKVTPRCGLVYMYQKDSNLYANYAQAFRTPTIGQMFTYSGTSANPDLKPEEATNYEIGLHHRFNEFLKTNVSLYWMELDNEIWFDNATSKYQNCGKTSHKGIETGLDFKISKSLSGFANYTYSVAKNESGSYKGEYLISIPIYKASSGLHFATDFGLSWDLAITYIGSSYIDSTNDNKLPSYTTADTKVSYQYKAMKIFLAVDNLLDKEYNSYGYVSSNTKYFYPVPGRTFTGGIEVKF